MGMNEYEVMVVHRQRQHEWKRNAKLLVILSELESAGRHRPGAGKKPGKGIADIMGFLKVRGAGRKTPSVV